MERLADSTSRSKWNSNAYTGDSKTNRLLVIEGCGIRNCNSKAPERHWCPTGAVSSYGTLGIFAHGQFHRRKTSLFAPCSTLRGLQVLHVLAWRPGTVWSNNPRTKCEAREFLSYYPSLASRNPLNSRVKLTCLTTV
jgi:hypothetical protein